MLNEGALGKRAPEDADLEKRDLKNGGLKKRGLKKRGKIHRGLIVIGSAVPSIGGFARGLWANEGGRKWLAPLVVFLCVTGLVLVLAASVEAIAPFIYTIF